MKNQQQLPRVEVKVDRLSPLPDAILILILSLLPIESSVATGVLSQRWCRLWTHITNFRFQISTGNASNASSIINHLIPQVISPEIESFVLDLDDHQEPRPRA